MEFHETIDPTRTQAVPWWSQVSTSSPPTSAVPLAPHPQYSDLYTPQYPFAYALPPGQDWNSYGSASGSRPPCQFHLVYQAHQTQSRKRRRLDTPSALHPLEMNRSSSFSTHEETGAFKAFRREGGENESSRRRSDSFHASLAPSGNMTWAQTVVGLTSLFCPCCGFSWSQSDGYHPIPEAPPATYGSERPYVVEKPPSMQPNAQASLVPRTMKSAQQHLIDGDSLPMLPSSENHAFVSRDDTKLSVSSDGGGTSNEASPTRVVNFSDEDSSMESRLLPEESPSTMSQTPLDSISPPSQPVQGVMAVAASPAVYASDVRSQAVPQKHPLAVLPSSSQRPAGFLEQDSVEDVPPRDQTSNFDILQPNQRGGKRGPFKDQSLRKQTAQTRRIGCCIRCRLQRIRCEGNDDEPNGPCLTCKKVANTRAGRFPCLRYKITDVRLYKTGQVPGYEWTTRWVNSLSDPIQKWASGDIKVIRVAEGYSNQSIELRVREFIPQDGDKLERTWSHGGSRRSVSIPPFALISIEEGRNAYESHIHASMSEAFTHILGQTAGLLNKTYQQALQCCKDKTSTPMDSLNLLRNTFRLWMSIRFSTRSSFIVGEETLGMPANILDDTSPTPNNIPLPPVLGAQLDLILIHHIQSDLRRKVLEGLEKMVSKRKHNTWMVTYLVTFILLHNTAMITAHDASYARKHGMDRRFAREDKVREYHLGANILLAHFHYCNKGVHPFSDECRDQDLRTLAGLTDDQIQFIHGTRAFVRRHRAEWEDLRARGDYEHDYFFVSQLFEEKWQPRSTI